MKLLTSFLLLEKEFDRDRKTESIRWGPRTLDIDLLAWGDLQVKNQSLILPHPRLTQRNFVLVPLLEAISRADNRPIRLASQKNWPE